ncbi:hypothetical protein [Faecalicatena orotica]|uniref:hypothetical protein n=1 Tax=Faecalicatena orotica TaxID=1544 RepID=UPI0011B1E4F9|nr:hypothetical protein [Faecalicatena orotica]
MKIIQRRKPRPRDRPVTCRQYRRFSYCMEASRMYPCQEFERWGQKQMSDRELMVALVETILIGVAMAAVYIRVA